MEDEIDYMAQHPPRCLGGKVSSCSDKLRCFLVEQLGDHSTVFTPVCECGNALLAISCSDGSAHSSVSCLECGKARGVFDSREHGYNGELGLNAGLELAEQIETPCLKCGNKELRIAYCFQYSGETDILEEEDPPNVKAEDLFGWVMIAAQCGACDSLQVIGQEECA